MHVESRPDSETVAYLRDHLKVIHGQDAQPADDVQAASSLAYAVTVNV